MNTHTCMSIYMYRCAYLCVCTHIDAFGFLFVHNFCIRIYKWYWPVIFFSCISANFSHQNFTVHIKWSENCILWMSLHKTQIICFINIPGILPTIWAQVEINIVDLCKRKGGAGLTQELSSPHPLTRETLRPPPHSILSRQRNHPSLYLWSALCRFHGEILGFWPLRTVLECISASGPGNWSQPETFVSAYSKYTLHVNFNGFSYSVGQAYGSTS